MCRWPLWKMFLLFEYSMLTRSSKVIVEEHQHLVVLHVCTRIAIENDRSTSANVVVWLLAKLITSKCSVRTNQKIKKKMELNISYWAATDDLNRHQGSLFPHKSEVRYCLHCETWILTKKSRLFSHDWSRSRHGW